MTLPRYRARANVYAANRRAAAVLRGDCQVCCKRPVIAALSRCAECHERQQAANQRVSRAERTYVPIDDIMDRPRVRVLRQLRWLDWSTSTGLFDLMDLPLNERNKHGMALVHARTSGQVERRDAFGKAEYRITKAGRDYLRRTFNDYEQRLGEGVAA